ncbi:MAG: hypothetical protein WAV32_03800, partial [Halobacteriota archaeon]
DTTPPELTVLTPEEGKTYATREILLTVKADEPSSHWRYRLNNGVENVTFAPVAAGNVSVNITLKAEEGTNRVVIYAEDSAGNTGEVAVSFRIMEPHIATELSMRGTGSFLIEKKMTSKAVAVNAEQNIVGVTGAEDNYTIESQEILSDSANRTDPNSPNYYHTSLISFSGGTFKSSETYGSPASEGGIGATLTEDITAQKLEKQTTTTLKTISAESHEQTLNTTTTAAFIGKRETEVNWSTPTKKVAINQMLDGNCTAGMSLTFKG